MTELFWLEGYCYFLDFLRIACYPITNCVTGWVNGLCFPSVSRQLISSFGNNEAIDMNGVSVSQLQCIFYQSCIPYCISYGNRYRFFGDEAFIHFMVFNCLGETKLKLRQNYFGRDPRDITYSICLFGIHLYENFIIKWVEI